MDISRWDVFLRNFFVNNWTKLQKKINYLLIFPLTLQRIKEHIYITEIILLFFIFVGVIGFIFRRKKFAFKVLSQVHRTTRLHESKFFVEKFIKKIIFHTYNIKNDSTFESIEPYISNRIMVLKWPNENLEKGVLYIKYSETFRVIPRMFDMESLLRDYRIVLEPSWSGYCDEDILHFTKYKEEIYILSPELADHAFIERLDSNLKALPFGASDWVDPRLFDIYEMDSNDKVYDVVMNAHWGRGKRHYVLFKALSELPFKIKVALIGFPWKSCDVNNIIALADYFGVSKQLTFFEKIPYKEVINVTSKSKMGILLSLKEGSNRAIPECLFCDIPVIILSQHIGGVNRLINDMTGQHVSQSSLRASIEDMLNHLEIYEPRKWALDNISCIVTTHKLNAYLKERACFNGEPWTRDIVPKTNSMDLKYYDASDVSVFRKYNFELRKYLVH